MTNTAQSFKDKWEKNQQLAFAETSRVGSDTYQWILKRNGFADAQQLSEFLINKHRILDAGCGNGRVTNLLAQHATAKTQIVAVDLVAAEVARVNLSHRPNISVSSADLLGSLVHLGLFDFIYCQEVLHHTDDPKRAFLNLCKQLAPGGEIAIYVYKKKAPAREFVDDYIRDRIAPLPYDEAIKTAQQISELGRALDALNIEFDAPAVDVLEIPEGRYTVQRFFYHFFMKCYWNHGLSREENDAVNYDWYHPQIATRHTLDEVLGWFAEAGLEVSHQLQDFYGITVRGVNLKQG